MCLGDVCGVNRTVADNKRRRKQLVFPADVTREVVPAVFDLCTAEMTPVFESGGVIVVVKILM